MQNRLFSKEEISWILYDVGNSAFVLIMVTAIMPIYFSQVGAAGTGGSESFSIWAFANSFASLLLALLSPLLGTLSDYRGMKKNFFVFFLVCGIASTLLLTIPRPGMYMAVIIFYVVSRTFWSGSLIFYDSFITDITNDERIDTISAHGFGWGYIGSVIPFLAALALLIFLSPPETIKITEVSGKLTFVIVAIWWGLFSIPLIQNVSQKNYVERDPQKSLFSASFGRLWDTLKHIAKFKNIVIFLIAYFFYIDGVHTIISMSIAYGTTLGLSQTVMISAVLMIQIFAWPFAILYGKGAQKFSARSLIGFGILVYALITVLAFVMSSINDRVIQTTLFWILAFLVATSQGGVQALSRSLFGRLIPDSASGEFFGFYNIVGKFAAILGPFIMGILSQKTGNSSYGIVGILPLFITGFVLLLFVNEKREEKLIA
jgi:UMF1 family MFS transporter